MERKFNFLNALPRYREHPALVRRLELRHRLVIDPFLEFIENARVLDIGCHDGRWAYAMAQAGARKVVGVDGRLDLISRFDRLPDDANKEKVRLYHGDMMEFLQGRVERVQSFDVVALLGIFYHTMEHMNMLKLVKQLQPRLIIIDSEFINADNAMMQLLWEETSNPLNAVVPDDTLGRTIVGVPSFRAMEFMAEVIGYEVTWFSADLLMGDNRDGVEDYFRPGRKIRATCSLTPREVTTEATAAAAAESESADE